MGMTVVRLAGRGALLGGAVGGAFHGAHGVTAAPLDPTTRAACASSLPGTGARCGTDRFLTEVGPYLIPVGLGAVAGMALVAGILLVLRIVGLALHASRAAPPLHQVSPTWGLAPRPDPNAIRGPGPLPVQGRTHPDRPSP